MICVSLPRSGVEESIHTTYNGLWLPGHLEIQDGVQNGCQSPNYTVSHKGGIIIFTPNNVHVWNDFDNDLFLLDLHNSIHSQILLNNSWRVFVCVTA